MRLLLLCLFFSFHVYAQENTATQLNDINQKIKELTSQLTIDNDQHAKLQETLKKLDLDIAQSAQSLQKTQAQLGKTKDVLKSLNATYEKEVQRLSQQQSALKEQIRGVFLLGQFDTLKLLLNQSDPHTLGRLLTYYDYFNNARTKIMQEMQGSITTLEQTKVAQLLQEEKLQLLETEQTHTYAQIQAQKKAQSALVAELLAAISEKNLNLETLQADKQALESVIIDLKDERAQKPFTGNTDKPIRDHKGRLSWPVQGKVISRFGDPYIANNTWQGILIAAPEGTDIRAIYKGQVVYADWLRGFGLIIIVDHGHEYMSLYAHNQSLYKNAGDWVDVNEPIAQVGKSGPVANTGLYFEIRSKGEVQNPMSWLAPATS